MSAFDFKRVMQSYVELFGNAHAEVQRNRLGDVVGLWPIPPWLVTKKRDGESRKIYYEVRTPDGPAILRDDQVFHLRGIGNGLAGFRPVELAKNAIGLAVATEEFGSKFFANGATSSGIAEYPGKLSKQALDDFKKTFSETYAGLGNAHRILFLEQGLKFHEMTVPNEASQFMETRSFQALEVCRFFGVPPHKIGILDRATFSNIEHQGIEYVTDCIEPRCVQWEQEIRRVLLQGKEQQSCFAKFNLSTLLRGDVKSRGAYYNMLRQNGVLSANDIRELEDMTPISEDEGGDRYLVNGNMIPMAGATTKEG
jgi:HK97 family phage portal protein